jgi:hypothetical protein
VRRLLLHEAREPLRDLARELGGQHVGERLRERDVPVLLGDDVLRPAAPIAALVG